ncbi:tetratricopeptide repeat protein [Cryobacterium sp. Sr8]|uniref:tetratricopeptide repeat protein n=1 Tax=Cryobacterium sp. Sr8 TaxID=1259203 RepID=UPI00106A051D|nr:tetratricopeptide repeat protein [Cryobacterium sp. Sr8]TFD77600.1 tetratricopeptide repeat protein [Cryobacterium sp. Sr8]
MTVSSPISQTLLDALWDFHDPAASAERFRRAEADAAHDDDARAELQTQLARALGLQGSFDEGHAVLDDIDMQSPSGRVRARAALERGRLYRSAGEQEQAVPLFTLAAREAASAGAQFIALDALHMLAVSDSGHEEEWTIEGLLVLDKATDDRTRRWGVALHNNLAWYLHDSGRPEEALGEFELALTVATDVGTPEQRFIGRWGVARCLRTLGRRAEALAIQQELAAERPYEEFVRAELAQLAEVDDYEK